jgi:hypothetical protein
MKTLQDLINQGNLDILNCKGDTACAAIYMAYHAGISKGDMRFREEMTDIILKQTKEAKSERYHNLATKYIPEVPRKVLNPEYQEILNFEYNL